MTAPKYERRDFFAMRLFTFIAQSVLFSFAILIAPHTSFAAEATGLWLTGSGESRVQITNCGNALCGQITWLQEDAAKGKQLKDTKNKDRSLRKNTIQGLRVLKGLKRTGDNNWKGQAYNPGDGNTYTSKLKREGNSLLVEGCILGGLVCKKQIWYKLNPANGEIQGNWYVANGKQQIAVRRCGNLLCTKVNWVEPGQSQDLLGRDLVIDMKSTGPSSWKGKVLNPQDGKTYSATIQQINGNTVELEACLVGGMGCRKLFWHRS